MSRACRRSVPALVTLSLCGLAGCAAMTNPVADGIPVRKCPPELLAPPREAECPLPLNLLRQPPPAVYRLGPGDVLGLYVEGVLGERGQPLPINLAPAVGQPQALRRQAPAAGYPVPVEPDGTLALPVGGPLKVEGMTLAEAREAIRKFYADKGLLKPETDRVLVSLVQPRQYQVLVVRQEGSAFTQTALEGVLVSGNKRGTGYLVDLPAYENDVLHALLVTGGLPGRDVCDAVVIERDAVAAVAPQLAPPPGCAPPGPPPRGAQTLRIPLRLPPGAKPHVRPEDVILQTGDVVYLEPCADVFYTGGLLPPGEHILPRDRDLDVVEAVSRVRGPLFNGDFGGSNLAGNQVLPGIGNPSPTLLTVLRKVPGGGQVPIVVDLGRAVRDPAERIRVRCGDLLVLQEKPEEALTRYVTQTFFNFDVFWQAFRSSRAIGVVDVAAPDRLPQRVGTITNVVPTTP